MHDMQSDFEWLKNVFLQVKSNNKNNNFNRNIYVMLKTIF